MRMSDPSARESISRREALLRGVRAGAALAFGGPALLGGCGGLSPGGLDVAGSPRRNASTVAASEGLDLYAITREALERMGGIGRVVAPGESVFIKPNLLTAGLPRTDPTQTGEIAKPEVIVATAEACLEAGAREVIIGDGAQVPVFDWESLRTLDGRTHLAAEAARLNAAYENRVRLACLNVDSPAWVPLPAKRTALGEIFVSSLVARADRVISIPVLKTHRWATVSLSLKNFMGVTPISRYGGGSEDVGRAVLHHVLGGLEGAFLDLVDGIQPDLAVVDGSVCCEDYGPWVRPGEGRRVDLRERRGAFVVLAGRDPVAVDATATRIMSHEPQHVRHLQRAYEQGLGQLDAGRIDLVGALLDDLRMEWEPI